MRFKGFWLKTIGTVDALFVPFEEIHYKAAGLLYSPVAGMPVLEAFQLVNQWNMESIGVHDDVYFLKGE